MSELELVPAPEPQAAPNQARAGGQAQPGTARAAHRPIRPHSPRRRTVASQLALPRPMPSSRFSSIATAW